VTRTGETQYPILQSGFELFAGFPCLTFPPGFESQ
jgi:hypothetical protein